MKYENFNLRRAFASRTLALYRCLPFTKNNMHHKADKPWDKCECETIIAVILSLFGRHLFLYEFVVCCWAFVCGARFTFSADKLAFCLVRFAHVLDRWIKRKLTHKFRFREMENVAASTRRDDDKSGNSRGKWNATHTRNKCADISTFRIASSIFFS